MGYCLFNPSVRCSLGAPVFAHGAPRAGSFRVLRLSREMFRLSRKVWPKKRQMTRSEPCRFLDSLSERGETHGLCPRPLSTVDSFSSFFP